jgi:hypothetical protein
MSTATINMTKGRANDSNMRVLYRTFSTACRKGVLGLRDDAAVAGRMTGQSVIMVKQVPIRNFLLPLCWIDRRLLLSVVEPYGSGCSPRSLIPPTRTAGHVTTMR